MIAENPSVGIALAKALGVTGKKNGYVESVKILEEDTVPKPSDFSIAEYMNSSFSMFSGESRDVKLRFDNKLINTVIDRFGKDVSLIPDGNEHFTVHVKVKAEAPFFAWVFQFGSKAKIVEPEELKTRYLVHLNEVLETMK